MGLHCSDAAYEILNGYVADAQGALYACYFLVAAVEHATSSVFPSDGDAIHWVAKAMHHDAGLDELKPIKEQIRASGFLKQLAEADMPLLVEHQGRVKEYHLTRQGKDLAEKLRGMMEC